MLSPQSKQALLDYIGGIRRDIESGADPKQVTDKLRKSMRMWAAAEAGMCPYCGLIASHSPTASCTGYELELGA